VDRTYRNVSLRPLLPRAGFELLHVTGSVMPVKGFKSLEGRLNKDQYLLGAPYAADNAEDLTVWKLCLLLGVARFLKSEGEAGKLRFVL
jgi:hypothetical protein